MSKSMKASSTDRFGEQKKKLKFRKILEKHGIPSLRLGGYEYMVATNLMILEQLKAMGKPSLLDVS